MLRIVFMGTPDFAKVSLEKVYDEYGASIYKLIY